jgi:hypothetical protein
MRRELVRGTRGRAGAIIAVCRSTGRVPQCSVIGGVGQNRGVLATVVVGGTPAPVTGTDGDDGGEKDERGFRYGWEAADRRLQWTESSM